MDNKDIYIIGVIVVIWIFIVGARIGAYFDSKIEKEVILPKKVCPLHDWEWEEQVGIPGTYYVRCKRCRKLPGWDKE
jgi:hypothetical protein